MTDVDTCKRLCRTAPPPPERCPRCGYHRGYHSEDCDA